MLLRRRLFPSKRCLATAVAMLAISSTLLAQECDPSKFLIEEVDLATLDVVTASRLITKSSQTWSDSRRKSIASAFKIGGDTGSLSFDSARSRASAIEKALDHSYSASEERVLFQRRLSQVGATAYSKCIDGQRNQLVLDLPMSAISSNQFAVKIKWKVNTPEAGQFKLRLSAANGEFEENSRDFGPNQETSIILRARDRSRSTTIAARVVKLNSDGSSGEIQSDSAEVPPNLQVIPRISQKVEEVVAEQPTGKVNEPDVEEHCFIPTSATSVLIETSASFSRIESRNAWRRSFPVKSSDQVCIKLEAIPKNDRPAFVRGKFFVNELAYERSLVP